MSNLFQTLELEAFRKGITPRTKESMKWFQGKAQQLAVPNRRHLMREEPLKLKDRQSIGNMFMYFYDPKHKKTLPYYDTFPLTIIVKRVPQGFHGLNLHYLPPTLRAKFLDALLDNMTNKRYDESTKFRMNYQLLKSSSQLDLFKPCYKHYINKHVRSRFAYIPPPEWEIATFLPVADFQKESKSYVWKQSSRIAAG